MSNQQMTSPQQQKPGSLTEAQRSEIKTLIQKDLPGLDIHLIKRTYVFGGVGENPATVCEPLTKQEGSTLEYEKIYEVYSTVRAMGKKLSE